MRRGEGKGSDTEKEGCDPLDYSPMLAGLSVGCYIWYSQEGSGRATAGPWLDQM